MPRNSDTERDFNIYEFDISLTLRRKVDRYSSDTLATVRVERTVPLATDPEAKHHFQGLVMEEMDRVLGVTQARIDFENRVKALTGGDVIDADDC